MKDLTTAVAMGSSIQTVDTIEHAGALWLVPLWGDFNNGATKIPLRMICLSVLPHQKTSNGPHDFILSESLPEDLFDYNAPLPKNNYIVVEPARLQISERKTVN
ncbi:hypothetical protein [Rhodospira trueperi]|uniref:hypothetical protein n=1 Tax=Rhodospira trueperi TaxID=69960 RepID=UPI0011600943|nr:hypothetical protein [Rhodospira trueperi]